MTAVTSYKPQSKSKETHKHQLRAKESWERAFDRICCLQPHLDSPYCSDKTLWYPGEDFPQIRMLVSLCAQLPGWSCIINGDIIVGFRMRFVEQELGRINAQCAISLRWQIPDNRIVDQGLDWFAATQQTWKAIEPRVPMWFRIGHGLWDTWMLAAFMHFCPQSCYDVTGSKVIFHPQHGSREQPIANASRKPNDGFIDKMRWPKRLPIVAGETSIKPLTESTNPDQCNP